MYSLYRAWLSLGPCGSLPTMPQGVPTATSFPSPLNLSLPTNTQVPGAPDVSLQVGPGMIQFAAHKSVLCTHSGYFKAALANHTGAVPISVPNVNVDEFSSLLTFMYTGFLDLNMANIYNILLATHILHMPRALEVCRSYLVHAQPETPRQPTATTTTTTVIKPIPSRKAPLPSSTQEIFQPTFGCLKKSEDTPFKVVGGSGRCNDAQKASTSKSDVDEEEKKSKTSMERQKTKRRSENNTNSEKFIIDIACCDGPVKFHRVINKNYGLQPLPETAREEINKNAAMNKAMNQNIREKISDENDNDNQNELYTCLYCNHTFKSQYCYQKHARRHLNPVSLEAKQTQKENKREVKLLDMNVQYYPCKTCGSKFPSYYFVHKHRKMCHAEELTEGASKSNANENSTDNVEDTSSSSIDVEAVEKDNN